MQLISSELRQLFAIMSLGVLATTTPASAQSLSGKQIAETHVGKCLHYWGPSEGTECFKANGTVSYTDKTYGKDKGRWKIDGNRMCVRYSKEDATECSRYKVAGDGVYTDGTYFWRLK